MSAHPLDRIHAFIGRFVVYPSPEAQTAHALWIAHAHLMGHWDSTPRLAFLSPEPGSGKSRALEVTALLVPRPVETVNATPAYLFRKVADPAGLPTLLYDEIDTVFGPKPGEADWVKLGVLAYLGYHVGETSELTRSGREAILRRVFSMSLPPIESPDYMASWGKPASAARLKKMADSLASFTRSAKRRKSADMSTAIAERESDLKMLYDQFYVKKFGFGWPSV